MSELGEVLKDGAGLGVERYLPRAKSMGHIQRLYHTRETAAV